MITDHASLTVRDLPARAQALAPDELSEVFGGCAHKEEECHGDKECCKSGMVLCKNDVCTGALA